LSPNYRLFVPQLPPFCPKLPPFCPRAPRENRIDKPKNGNAKNRKALKALKAFKLRCPDRLTCGRPALTMGTEIRTGRDNIILFPTGRNQQETAGRTGGHNIYSHGSATRSAQRRPDRGRRPAQTPGAYNRVFTDHPGPHEPAHHPQKSQYERGEGRQVFISTGRHRPGPGRTGPRSDQQEPPRGSGPYFYRRT